MQASGYPAKRHAAISGDSISTIDLGMRNRDEMIKRRDYDYKSNY
jgi:hypothetical protein